MKAIHQLKDDRQLNFAEYSAKLSDVLRENGVADQADIIHQCQCTNQNAVKGIRSGTKACTLCGYGAWHKELSPAWTDKGIPQNNTCLRLPAQRKTHAEDIYYSLAKHADIKVKCPAI